VPLTRNHTDGAAGAAETFIVTLLEVDPPELEQVMVNTTYVVRGTVYRFPPTFGVTLPIDTIKQLVALAESQLSRAVEPYGTTTDVAPFTKKLTIGGVTTGAGGGGAGGGGAGGGAALQLAQLVEQEPVV